MENDDLKYKVTRYAHNKNSCLHLTVRGLKTIILLLLRAKRVTLYLRSSFFMMCPTGPQLNTQGFPEHFGGGGGGGGGRGGGDFVGWT